MQFARKSFFKIFLALLFLLVSASFLAHAQTATPTPTSTTNSANSSELNKRIAELEKKLAETRSQANSLSSQIGVMDNQIKLTEARINFNKQQILDLTLDIDSATKRVKNLEGSLSNVSKVLINRIVTTYEVGAIEPIHVLVSSTDISDLIKRANYLKIVQAHDKKLMYNAQQARNDYENQKNIFEDKKAKIETLKSQLEGYTAQLDADKISKEKLLVTTQGDEKTYQRLLNEAKAQISSFKSFSSSQGGSVLPPQASPDGWYYNQRDSRWGNNSIGSSSESVWQVGCLVTATTMLRKQRGENITPADVARESSYFFSNTAMMNNPWNGGRFTSKWEKGTSGIDAKLSSGQPVIVGLNAGPYGTHFIAVKSGSEGNYIMNDPWNGPDLNFSSYYSTGQIFQYGYLN